MLSQPPEQPDRAESRHAPEPAPEVIMDANGNYWRRYPEHLSMPPVSTDNEPLATPVVVYRLVGRDADRAQDLAAIRTILAAYRSEGTRITEEQITAAWAAFEAIKRAVNG